MSFTKKITIDVIDWAKVPKGTYFEAKRNNYSIKGVINKANGRIYLCHCNDNVGGLTSIEKLTEKYAISIGDGSEKSLRECYTTDLKLFENHPFSFKTGNFLPKIAGYNVQILKNSVKVGCQTILKKDILHLVSKFETTKTKVKK